MWGRKNQAAAEAAKADEPQRLKDALRRARIDAAERTGVVVDLHDAEVARLELLNEALDPLFAEIPAEVDLFDRGISRGETPRLWIDAIAHVAMGRDKRIYRFLQDTRYGRKVLAENVNIPEIVEAVTKYVAQRMIERERALAETGTPPIGRPSPRGAVPAPAPAVARVSRVPVRRCSQALRCWSRSALLFPGRANALARARSIQFDHAVAGHAARDHLAAPGAARAFDAIEIVAGGIVLAGRRFRRRRHADRRNAPVRSVEPDGLAAMVVAVDHQLRAMTREHLAQARAVGQPLEIMRTLAGRRMMDAARRDSGPSRPQSSRIFSSRCNCSAPTRPVAMNGRLGTEVDTPISASGPRRRRNGKPAATTPRPSSPRMKSPQCVSDAAMPLRT